MTEVIITVRGEHEARVAPERAIAHVSASVDGPRRADVIERVSTLTAHVRDDLAARTTAGTIDEWSSQRMSVWADRPWNSDGRQLDLVHHASVDFTATFTDFAAMSDWVGDVATREGMQVGHIDWQLSPPTRRSVEAHVAAAAVTVAVDRARAYAAAIGLTDVTAREIADLGLLTGGADAEHAPRMLAASAKAMDAAASGPAGFHPDDIVVTAAVEARFTAK